MSNADKWFYNTPEPIPYLITERLNNTFWKARIVGVYWRTTQAAPPYRAEGLLDDEPVSIEWEPGVWLALGGPDNEAFQQLADAVGQRVLARKPAVTYEKGDNRRYIEWHVEENGERWRMIQGKPEFIAPQKL